MLNDVQKDLVCRVYRTLTERSVINENLGDSMYEWDCNNAFKDSVDAPILREIQLAFGNDLVVVPVSDTEALAMNDVRENMDRRGWELCCYFVEITEKVEV